MTHIAGHVSEAHGVFTYRADDEGKLSALRAFWEVDQMMAAMEPAPA